MRATCIEGWLLPVGERDVIKRDRFDVPLDLPLRRDAVTCLAMLFCLARWDSSDQVIFLMPDETMSEAEWRAELEDEMPGFGIVVAIEGAQLRVTLSRDTYETSVLYDLPGLELELVVVNSRLLTSDWPTP